MDLIQTNAQSFNITSIHINICNIKIWLNNTKENYYCDQLFMQFHLHNLEHLHSQRLRHANWLSSWDRLWRFVVDLLKLCSRLKDSPCNGSYFLPYPSNSLVIVTIIFDIWWLHNMYSHSIIKSAVKQNCRKFISLVFPCDKTLFDKITVIKN